MGTLFTLLPLILGAINNPQVQAFLPVIQTVLAELGKAQFPTVDPAKAAAAGASLFDTNAIRWVQVTLNVLESEKLDMDGIPGQATKDAVTKYQTKRGLVADGWPGAITVASLQKDLLGK